LYFASSSDPNETWVPLYEKAYAKAHGDYESIDGGFTGEAIEDLTGGVSTLFKVKDILDEDLFWHDELLHANKDRLFACYIELDYPDSSGQAGLVPQHAYSILEAKEVNDRKFVVIRNPWGEQGEWQGDWSDGSKLWTPEWMKALGHTFGNDGRFIMEYKDFLKTWQTIDRCLLFDEKWHISSAHVEAKLRPWPAAPTFGDVCFTVLLTERTPAIFVLSQHDSRYWKGLEGNLWWRLEFRVFKAGEKDYLARSEKGWYDKRSVNVEFKNLDPGEYIVHVRLDRSAFRNKDYMDTADCSDAKLYRVQAKLMESRALAPNYNREEAEATYLAPPSDVYDGRPLSKIPRVDIVGKVVEKDAEKAGTPLTTIGKTVTINDSPNTVTFELDEPPQGLTEDKESASDKEEVGVQADSTPEDGAETAKSEGTQTEKSETGESKPAEERYDIDVVVDEDSEEADAAGKADADKRADGEKEKDGEGDGEGDAPKKEVDEKKAKEEERANADSVFLLFRVYSMDSEAKIGAETRL